MRTTKRVTIEFSYDTEDCDHPSTWDWATLFAFPFEDIHRVEVFAIPTVERTGETTE